MPRPARKDSLIPVTVKLDNELLAQATLVAAVAGRSRSSTLVEALALGLEELRYQQKTMGRRTSGALLNVAPGVYQLRVTTSDPELTDLLIATLNACEEQANRKETQSMIQPYSDKSDEPSLKAALESYRDFASQYGAQPGEAHHVTLANGHAVIQFVEAPSAPSAAVQGGA